MATRREEAQKAFEAMCKDMKNDWWENLPGGVDVRDEHGVVHHCYKRFSGGGGYTVSYGEMDYTGFHSYISFSGNTLAEAAEKMYHYVMEEEKEDNA